MKRMFLASEFSVSGHLLPQFWSLPTNPRIAYIGNAADIFPGYGGPNANRDAFGKLGFEMVDVDLRKVTAESLRKELSQVHAVYVDGGSTSHLLQISRDSGFARIVTELVEKGDVVYIGTSAGSMITGPSIESTYALDGPDRFGLDDMEGLSLVNFVLIPHMGNDDFYAVNKALYAEMFTKLESYPYPHICLRDEQAVWVEGTTMRIVE